jgi:hypothetical protein
MNRLTPEESSRRANRKLAKRPKWLKTLANMKRGDSMRSRDKPLRVKRVTLAERFNPEDWK